MQKHRTKFVPGGLIFINFMRPFFNIGVSVVFIYFFSFLHLLLELNFMRPFLNIGVSVVFIFFFFIFSSFIRI